ncbi:MAG: hypothetical protein HXX11_07545 [Desulfuromonadales bacterium]|nr:hypothetical protein [Desulfuromonadales bacterium]
MKDSDQETHTDNELNNEELQVKLIERLVDRFKERYCTPTERHEALELIRVTLNL